MGKTGKAKKRRKMENSLIHDRSDDESIDEIDYSMENANNSKIFKAAQFLEKLSCRMDIYASKQLKPLRVSLHGIIQHQLTKHFEPAPERYINENDVESLLKNSKDISAVVEIAHYYSTRPDEFQDSKLKSFRRSLHPFVTYYLMQSGKVKMNPKKDLYLDGSSLSLEVTKYLRHHDYHRAYEFLQKMAYSIEEVPKLGIL